jgi:hypothetical protein
LAKRYCTERQSNLDSKRIKKIDYKEKTDSSRKIEETLEMKNNRERKQHSYSHR